MATFYLEHDGMSVAVSAGELVRVTLPAFPGTGQTWWGASPGSCLVRVGEARLSGGGSSRPARRTWTFLAVGPGRTAVDLRLSEGPGHTDVARFSLVLRVMAADEPAPVWGSGRPRLPDGPSLMLMDDGCEEPTLGEADAAGYPTVVMERTPDLFARGA